MAYNYLSLVNDINRRLNEVELTEDNFANASGFYSFAKDSVNSAIRHINQEEFEWPWNHTEEELVLNEGTVRYGIPSNTKSIDMDSFRVIPSSDIDITSKKLKVMQYEEWLDKHVDTEYNSSDLSGSVPTHIVRTPSREIIIYPMPDKDYTVVYEYYLTAFQLINPTDVPDLPEQYRHVIVDGAMYYTHQFRGDYQAANFARDIFEKGIKHLRSIHINRTQYLRDTRVHF